MQEAIRQSKQDASFTNTQSDPYEADTQEDPHSQLGSPGYIPSQESSQSGVETADNSQSDPGGSPARNDVNIMTVTNEQSGIGKSSGRKSFRLSPSLTDEEEEEDQVKVNREKTETSGSENRQRKSVGTPTSADGMFDKVTFSRIFCIPRTV